MSHYPGPFTQFGQFGPGMLDLRVFDQEEYWVDASGNGHRLVDMSDSYRSAVVEFCLRNCSGYFTAHTRVTARAVLQMAAHGDTTDRLIAVAIAENMLELKDPWTWLEGTPLLRALRALTPQAPTLEDLVLDEIE